MTVAVHTQQTRLPWARVLHEDGLINGYQEKPAREVDVSSAYYVVSDHAAELGRASGRCDAPELVTRLLGVGETIAAYVHHAPWVDVNDMQATSVASAMVLADPSTFDDGWIDADVEVAGLVAVRGAAVLVEARPADARAYPGQLDTPGGKLEAGEAPEDALRREIREELGSGLRDVRRLAVFTDFDRGSARFFRHHVFAAVLDRDPVAREQQDLRWMPISAAIDGSEPGTILRRSLQAYHADRAAR